MSKYQIQKKKITIMNEIELSDTKIKNMNRVNCQLQMIKIKNIYLQDSPHPPSCQTWVGMCQLLECY